MLPVAAPRPLWWLARTVVRLLTGFAVAAAFTLGAWAMPAYATSAGDGSAWQRPAVTVAGAPAAVPTPATSDGCAAAQLTIDPLLTSGDDRPAGGSVVVLVSPLRTVEGADPGSTEACGSSPAVVTPGACSARAPPHH